MIGEYLYYLTEKELRSQPVLQRKIDRVSAVAASTFVSVLSFTVPADVFFLLQHVSIGAVAGAAQTATAVFCMIEDENGADLAALTETRAFDTLVLNNAWTESVSTVIMPGEHIMAGAFFSLGAVNNTVRLSTHGLLLPRGNLQLR